MKFKQKFTGWRGIVSGHWARLSNAERATSFESGILAKKDTKFDRLIRHINSTVYEFTKYTESNGFFCYLAPYAAVFAKEFGSWCSVCTYELAGKLRERAPLN